MTTPVRIVGIRNPWPSAVVGTDLGASPLGPITPTASKMLSGNMQTQIALTSIGAAVAPYLQLTVTKMWVGSGGGGGTSQSASAF